MWFLIKIIILLASSAILQYTVKNMKNKKFFIERQFGEDSPRLIDHDYYTFTDNWTSKLVQYDDNAPYKVNVLWEFPPNVTERSSLGVLSFEDKMVTKRPRIPVKNFSVAADASTLSFDININNYFMLHNKPDILKDYLKDYYGSKHENDFHYGIKHEDDAHSGIKHVDNVHNGIHYGLIHEGDVNYGMKHKDVFNASISLHEASKCPLGKIENISGYNNTRLDYAERKTKQQFNKVEKGNPENGTLEYSLEYVTLENRTLEYTLESTFSSKYQTCERYIEFVGTYEDSVVQAIYRQFIRGWTPSGLKKQLSRERNILVKEYAQRHLKDMLMRKPGYQRNINIILRFIKLYTRLINIVLKYLVKVSINRLREIQSIASKLLITTSKSCCNCASNFLQIVLNAVKRIMELSGFSFGQLYCLMLLVGFTLKIKLYYERKLEKLENDFEQHLESLHEILKTSTEDCKKQIEKYKMELEKSRIRSGHIMLAQIEKLEGMVVKLEAKRLLPPLGPMPPIPPPPPPPGLISSHPQPNGLLPPFILGQPPPRMTKQVPSQTQFAKPSGKQRCDQANKLDIPKPQNGQVMNNAPTRMQFMQSPQLPPPPPPMFFPRACGQSQLPPPPLPPPIFLPRAGGFPPNMRPNFERQQQQYNDKNNKKLYTPTFGGRCTF